MPSDNNKIKTYITQKDWKVWKKGWRYKSDAPHDREWKEDRKKLFRESGNGWWYYQGYHVWKDSAKR